MQMDGFSSAAVCESLGYPKGPLFLLFWARTRNRTLGIRGRGGWEASPVPGGARCVKPCTWQGNTNLGQCQLKGKLMENEIKQTPKCI